jgi:hypothetical protein
MLPPFRNFAKPGCLIPSPSPPPRPPAAGPRSGLSVVAASCRPIKAAGEKGEGTVNAGKAIQGADGGVSGWVQGIGADLKVPRTVAGGRSQVRICSR